jgi:hypothetical protein
MNRTEMLIAVSGFKDLIPKDGPLEDRISFAMKHVKENKRDIFWMSYEVSDDAMFRTALAAVMLDASEDEKELITKSMKPLQALSAAMSGIPVDFGEVEMDGILPLMEMWRNSAASDIEKKDS